MGLPVVIVASGGLPVVVSTSGYGLPMTVSTSGFGIAVTQATSGRGLAVTGITFGPDVTAPIITSATAVNNLETTVLAHTLTANEPVTWTLVGGVDQARFELSGNTLRWLTNGTKTYAAPNDSDANNTYIVQVRATDLASNPSTAQTVTVTVVVAAPLAPTLTLTSGTSDTTPDFTLTGDLRLNDTVRFQYSTASDFTGASELTNAIDAAEDTANTIAFTTGALAINTWYFRARIERPGATANGAWSNTETETIVAPTYTGPGDILSGALGWYGLRAYNAAYCTGSNPCIDITDQADANALTVNITTAGQLDTAAIATWVTAHSVTTIKITKIYNQSGGSLVHLPAVPGFPPHLILSASGLGSGKASMAFHGAGDSFFAAFQTPSNATLNQPYSVSAVASTDDTSTQYLWGSDPSNLLHYTIYRTDRFCMAAGAGEVGASSANSAVAFHAIQTTANNDNTGSIYVDGANASGSNGPPNTTFSGAPFRLGGNNSTVFGGRISEFGIWSGIFSSGNKSSLNTNQHTEWGF